MISWEWDEECADCDGDDDAFSGQAREDDWTYHICPLRTDSGEISGYQVSGGDAETGDMLGWSNGGPLVVPTLAEAKAAAEASYDERCQEVEALLDDYLDDGQDDGLHIWRDESGAVMCRVDEPDGEEICIEVNLTDSGDSGGYGSVSLGLRTFLGCGGSRSNLIEEVRRLV